MSLVGVDHDDDLRRDGIDVSKLTVNAMDKSKTPTSGNGPGH